MNSNSKYDLEVIIKLLAQAESDGLGFYDKWELIGAHYGVLPDTVRRWYSRNKDQAKPPKLKEANGNISSDQWRAAYLMLTGKTSRHKIAELKALLVQLLIED